MCAWMRDDCMHRIQRLHEPCHLQIVSQRCCSVAAAWPLCISDLRQTSFCHTCLFWRFTITDCKTHIPYNHVSCQTWHFIHLHSFWLFTLIKLIYCWCSVAGIVKDTPHLYFALTHHFAFFFFPTSDKHATGAQWKTCTALVGHPDTLIGEA